MIRPTASGKQEQSSFGGAVRRPNKNLDGDPRRGGELHDLRCRFDRKSKDRSNKSQAQGDASHYPHRKNAGQATPPAERALVTDVSSPHRDASHRHTCDAGQKDKLYGKGYSGQSSTPPPRPHGTRKNRHQPRWSGRSRSG